MARHLTLAIGGALAAAGVIAVLASRAEPVPAAVPPLQVSAAALQSAAFLQNGVSSYPLAPAKADMERVAAYWSPERLKQASSYEPSTKPSEPAATRKATTSAAELSRTRAQRTVTPLPENRRATTAPPMVGKVFFKVGAKEYWCSASVVHSKYRNLVATAGHCAYALAQDRPVENWIFIPSYQDGRADAGIFVGHTLYMHEDFAGKGDFDRDYAFVTVHRGFTWQPYTEAGKVKYRPADTGRVEDKVGAFRFSTGKSAGQRLTVFGYPAGAQPDGTRPFTGQVVRRCGGTTEKKFVSAPTWQLNYGVRLPGCGFTSGASGGPWVIGYNSVKRTGHLVGVTSLTWNLTGGDRLDAISAPYFNTLTQRVYAQATREFTG
ncbi:trypsin-like serine peptidase [Sphaerimonospora cavernae]|uniref:Trypsin-like serine peptidase n=1 Tax=Sphaerimonospora cavernae TaxID=1740611 RepID=A0ABV6U433_9ACTN